MQNILIIGKPNSGKSLLFNRLTGHTQKVANFPGVTVDIHSKVEGDFEYVDFPGIYSFNPVTKDEEVAVKEFKNYLRNDQTKLVLCLIDSTRMESSLLLGLQAQMMAQEFNKPILYVFNMMDELQSSKIDIDLEKISQRLNAEVIGVSARTLYGFDQLKNKIKMLSKNPSNRSRLSLTTQPAQFARQLTQELGPKGDVLLKKQNTLDSFFLSTPFGGIAFAVIMLMVFQSIFTWATPMMDFVEVGVASLGNLVSQYMSEGVVRDFINDALFGGIGSFLVFVPQIFVLTFIIGLLEDSGYLARAAVICHKPLSLFGLSGRSFVPLLSGHACAIPAIMASRTIESPKKRLLTMLVIPLMSCSARLPVYSLLIAALIPTHTTLGGLIGLQGFIFFCLYAFGILVGMIVSGVLSRTTLKTESDSPFVIELPSYRLPHWKPLLMRSFSSTKTFITKAGGVIFAVTVIVWVLGYFPHGQGHLQTSWLGQVGHFIEPVFAPLGLDWKFGVAVLASFLAREVFVGTLGTMFGIEGADENIAGLADNLSASGFSLASGVSLLIFYAIALQCVSTLAVLKTETGSKKIPIFLFLFYGILAYLLSLLAYNILI